MIPGVGTLAGFLIGLLATLWVIQAVFQVSLGTAFLIWLFHVFAEFATLVIGGLTFAGALLALLAAGPK